MIVKSGCVRGELLTTFVKHLQTSQFAVILRLDTFYFTFLNIFFYSFTLNLYLVF